MAHEHDKLRESLAALQPQLDALRQRDPAAAANLDSMVSQALAALGQTRLEPDQGKSIIKRFSDAVQKYEASHPVLAANLGSIIDALAQIGI